MLLTDLRPAPGSQKKSKRVGRGHGSGHGKTSTRGNNGQGQRSGESTRQGFEGGQMPLFRRTPKMHHFPMVHRTSYAEVNIESLAIFEANSIVTPELMMEAGLFKKLGDGLRVLGRGELGVALTVRADHFTKGAKLKIEAAGGQAEVIGA
ncbi:MAG TPA: 50S ribosomal protein L15 [Cyanobacteria bacterium UBA8530]|nr:50S ribosomal protein L15 [Cyanobacteria bacterium UBA8530]